MNDVKTEIIDMKSFMSKKNEPTFIVLDLSDSGKEIQKHFKKHGWKYVTGTLTLIIISQPDVVAASTGIDKGAMKIYRKLINIGKWVIIIKGGLDIVGSITNQDMDSAKKRFIGYLMAYAALFALPWGMGQVEILFQDEDVFKE
jgi:hypothetical protein